MKTALLLSMLAAGSFALASAPACAANADHPYQNVDPSNDKGNDTGDSQVDKLNSGQLDENQHPQSQQFATPAAPSAVVAPPGSVVVVPKQ